MNGKLWKISLLLVAALLCCTVVSCKKTINSHEYVDLGLSVKWASCNIGASSPEDFGDYYMWGNPEIETLFISENCDTYGIKMGDIAGNPDYDVARAKWGGTWRLPTRVEIEELVYNCTGKWTKREGVWGMLLTSKKNGNSIFLPAADITGRLDVGTLSSSDFKPDCPKEGSNIGEYMSSTPSTDYGAYCLQIFKFENMSNFQLDNIARARGISVRPVSE